ncbi:MAG: glycosyltransferase [Verrucomicrobia bacterium]|nr:glycosyltransferase [Verrucomicrobiota bacterium]
MRILVVYPYIPFPVDRGTYQRTFHLLRSLARDHTVDLLALSEAGERCEQKSVFAEFCRRVEFVPFTHPNWPRLFPDRLLNPLPATVRHWLLPHVREAIHRFADGERYDLAHVCDIVMAQYFLPQPAARNPPPVSRLPLAVDRSRVDLQFQLAQRDALSRGARQAVLDWENITKLKRFERRVARRAAVEVVCGPDDETFIRERISRDVAVQVVTNGVDLDYFTPAAAPEPRATEPTVLFCGAMDYTPNVDALRWFFAELHELLRARVPDLRVLIVGKAPGAQVQAYAQRPGVTVTGGVPDVRPFYRRAWLQIVPLRIGGGTRLKIPESLAMGTPVVSTTIGAQGLDLRHGHDLLLADTPEAFVRETARALTTPALRAHLETEGARTVHARLSWSRLGKQLSDYYANRFTA